LFFLKNPQREFLLAIFQHLEATTLLFDKDYKPADWNEAFKTFLVKGRKVITEMTKADLQKEQKVLRAELDKVNKQIDAEIDRILGVSSGTTGRVATRMFLYGGVALVAIYGLYRVFKGNTASA
jgi:hypothetical protein